MASSTTIFSFSTACSPHPVSSAYIISWKPKTVISYHSLPRTPRLAASCTHGLGNSIIASVSSSSTTHDDDDDDAERIEEEFIEEEFVDSDVPETQRFGLKEFFEEAQELIRSNSEEGPRWFLPASSGCNKGSRLDNAPLLLFLPGIDGTGLGLIRHHQRLEKIFEIRCLHIPPSDRTLFLEMVKVVERTIQSENNCMPNRPIYLVGESLGACIALSVASRNPEVDLALILSNPATSFTKSELPTLLHLMEAMPMELQHGLPHMLSLVAGDPIREAVNTMGKVPNLQKMIGELLQNLSVMTTYSHVLADILPKETLLWRLKLLKSASEFTNSRLHAVKAQTLILSSGKDQFLPSQDEGERLLYTISDCQLRKFGDRGHFLFLEEGIDLVYIIKATGFYRRSKLLDRVYDYIPPTPWETKLVCDSTRWISVVAAPVMLSTLEDSKIVRGLDGLPSEGPVLYVGYHMLLGLELAPLVSRVLTERKILLRGLAHPFIFKTFRDLSLLSPSDYDQYRIMGAVPVTAANFYKLLSSKSHVLLYPGGAREALHRKGEEYKLFWPEQAEFVRMAARFGAKIVPFGVVGEDDFAEVIVDYDDLLKIPYFKTQIEELKKLNNIKLRNENQGEVANQDFHLPWILPKFPGRFYYLFGKPIETEGRKKVLTDKANSEQLYRQIQSEVERCIAYLKEKRKSDPFRSILTRSIYHATQGFASENEIPTFEL